MLDAYTQALKTIVSVEQYVLFCTLVIAHIYVIILMYFLSSKKVVEGYREGRSNEQAFKREITQPLAI
jgi:hypothetical protein